MALSDIALKGGPALAALAGMTQSEDAEAIFAGSLAKNFVEDFANKAHKRVLQGDTPKEAWKEHGYFSGLDEKMRFEINDEMATLGKGLEDLRDPLSMRDSVYLDEILDHPELYENYPDLRQVMVKPLSAPKVANRIRGEFRPRQNEIGLDIGRHDNRIKHTALHEIQHYIQNKEGFSTGGSKEEFGDFAFEQAQKKLKGLDTRIDQYNDMYNSSVKNWKRSKANGDTRAMDVHRGEALEARKRVHDLSVKRDDLSEGAKSLTPYEQYLRLGGEYESRLVEGRLRDASPNTFPLDTRPRDPVPKNQVIRQSTDSPAHSSKRFASRHKTDPTKDKYGRTLSMADIARKAGSPFKNDASPYTSPLTGKLVDLAKGNKKLIGGPFGLLYPEGAVNWLEKLAKGQKPDWKDRVDVVMDLL